MHFLSKNDKIIGIYRTFIVDYSNGFVISVFVHFAIIVRWKDVDKPFTKLNEACVR